MYAPAPPPTTDDTFACTSDMDYQGGCLSDDGNCKQEGVGTITECIQLCRLTSGCNVAVHNADGECWLKGVHIGPCPNAGAFFQHEAKRERRLLLKKREIRKFDQTMRVKKLTLVPIKAYFNRDNRLKILLGLARGKNTQDKRDDVKDREGKRDIELTMRRLR